MRQRSPAASSQRGILAEWLFRLCWESFCFDSCSRRKWIGGIVQSFLLLFGHWGYNIFFNRADHSDIPDLTVRMCLQEIENASDDDTLQVLQERDDIQFLMAQAGFANEYLTLKSTKYLSCDVTKSMLSALDWIL